MGKELLLEIGTEEIPAGFLPKALKDMESIIAKELSEHHIPYGTIKTMGTPRRLFLSVADVAARQDNYILEKMGPAKRVAFDEAGKPTRAALGFAKGQGLDISEIEMVKTDKGEYICARKKITGEDTNVLLREILPRLITALPFKKSMRWMNLDLRFARPIHWILALLGGEIIPFNVANIASGPTTQGHRFMHPEPFTVTGLQDYLTKTKEHFVITDPGERKALIRQEAQQAATRVGGAVLENEALLEEVTFLVEYPTVVCGNFEEKYLKLPKEVPITSMMKHQKYFPVIDAAGNLLPYFITVINTAARDLSVVIKGNERVLRARLADAAFFFEEDRKRPLNDNVEALKEVVFHNLLGTSYEKMLRFRKLAGTIVAIVNPALEATVDRAAYLSKGDLETQMVYEFPELQGIMGREYALIAGENPVVAQAIYEHYLPNSAGGELPRTDEGAIVSIADKTDTIVGCFAVNLIPTGTADPYALRRQALGIINIILNKAYPLALDKLIDKSLSTLTDKLKREPAEIKTDVLEFFKGRFQNQLISQGHSYDVVDAVLEFGISDFVGALKKIEAIETFKNQPEFEPLVIAFKRVGNIIKAFNNGKVDPDIFEAPEERNLYNEFLKIKDEAAQLIDSERYADALTTIARLREPVDTFFNTILVMAEDEKVRFNRLSLLEEISRLFYRIADFSKIVTEG